MAVDSSQSTPGWFLGLLIVFALAAVSTFGLLLYRHAEDKDLYHYYVWLKQQELIRLENVEKELKLQAPVQEQAIAQRAEVIRANVEREKATRMDVERTVTGNAQTVAKVEELMKKDGTVYKTVLDDAKARRGELRGEEERTLAAERDFDERRSKQREQIEGVSRQLEQQRRETRAASKVRQDRIGELTGRVEQLTKQRETNERELRSDGQLIASRPTDGYVVVDRGHQHNLRKGTRFAVFNLRAGRKVVKGALEVVEVQARMAVCRVLEERDGNDPLLPGDHIHNPVYNPEDVKTFVIKGDFATFSREELARFVEESGGKVAAELGVETDYLVAGGRSDAALEQASKLGISILSEEQLIDFVRWRPRVTIQQGMTVVLKGRFTQVDEAAIRAFVIRNGGVVEGGVREGVSVLIAGEDAQDHVAKARLLGVPVYDQSEFSHIAGTAGQTK